MISWAGQKEFLVVMGDSTAQFFNHWNWLTVLGTQREASSYNLRVSRIGGAVSLTTKLVIMPKGALKGEMTRKKLYFFTKGFTMDRQSSYKFFRWYWGNVNYIHTWYSVCVLTLKLFDKNSSINWKPSSTLGVLVVGLSGQSWGWWLLDLLGRVTVSLESGDSVGTDSSSGTYWMGCFAPLRENRCIVAWWESWKILQILFFFPTYTK